MIAGAVQTNLVIDVGCASYGADQSVEPLVEGFRPRMLYGFDPSVQEGRFYVGRTLVKLERVAAWTHDGWLRFFEDGLNGHVVGIGGRNDPPPGETTPCIDLAAFILRQGPGPIVLKIDAEGAEYELLPDLIAKGADKLLALLWVEWHCLGCQKGAGHHAEGCADRRAEQRSRALISQLNCPVREWTR